MSSQKKMKKRKHKAEGIDGERKKKKRKRKAASISNGIEQKEHDDEFHGFSQSSAQAEDGAGLLELAEHQHAGGDTILTKHHAANVQNIAKQALEHSMAERGGDKLDATSMQTLGDAPITVEQLKPAVVPTAHYENGAAETLQPTPIDYASNSVQKAIGSEISSKPARKSRKSRAVDFEAEAPTIRSLITSPTSESNEPILSTPGEAAEPTSKITVSAKKTRKPSKANTTSVNDKRQIEPVTPPPTGKSKSFSSSADKSNIEATQSLGRQHITSPLAEPGALSQPASNCLVDSARQKEERTRNSRKLHSSKSIEEDISNTESRGPLLSPTPQPETMSPEEAPLQTMPRVGAERSADDSASLPAERSLKDRAGDDSWVSSNGIIDTDMQATSQLLTPNRSRRAKITKQSQGTINGVTQSKSHMPYIPKPTDTGARPPQQSSLLSSLNQASDPVHEGMYMSGVELSIGSALAPVTAPEPSSQQRDDDGSISEADEQAARQLNLGSLKQTGKDTTPQNCTPSINDQKKAKSLKVKTPLSAKDSRSVDPMTLPSVKGKERATPLSWNAVNGSIIKNGSSQIDVQNSSATPKKRAKRRIPAELPNGGEPGPSSSNKAKSLKTPKSSSTVTKKVKQPKSNIRASGIEVISGRFTDDELDTIKMELLKHREENDMTEYAQNCLIQGSLVPAKELWDQLSEVLPNRDRQAITKVCKRKFHNYSKRGKWDADEDEQLKELNEKFPKKWQKVADIMGRHPEDIRDRWRNYAVCGDNLVKDRWSEDEERALMEAIEQCLYSVSELKAQHRRLNPGSDEYTKPDIEYVDWQVVSSLLGHSRSRLQCIIKWKQIDARETEDASAAWNFNPDGQTWRLVKAKGDYRNMTKSDKIELLQGIRDSHAGREGKVPWGRLGGEGLKQFAPLVRKVAWGKLRATLEGHRDMKLQHIVDLLLKKFEANEMTNEPKSSQYVQDSDSELNEDMPETPKPIEKTPTQRTTAGTPKSAKELKVSRQPKKKMVDKMSTADGNHGHVVGNGEVPSEDNRLGMGTGIQELSASAEIVKETPTKTSRSRTAWTQSKPNKKRRVSPVLETSPALPLGGQRSDEYDSSVDDNDMEDIPAGHRELSAEL